MNDQFASASRRFLPYVFKKISLFLAAFPVVIFFASGITGSLPVSLFCEVDGFYLSANWLGVLTSHFVVEGFSSLMLVLIAFLTLGLNIEERLGTWSFLILLFFVLVGVLVGGRVITGLQEGLGFLYFGPYVSVFILSFLNPLLFPEEVIKFLGHFKIKSGWISAVFSVWSLLLLFINRGINSLLLVPVFLIFIVLYSRFILKLDIFYFLKPHQKDSPF